MSPAPSLNALRTFHAVADTLSISTAARELGVTPGAVSRQIKNLEESVGVALLVRDGRGMRLTADGKELERGLADVFSQIGAAVERLRRPVRGERLRVTVPPEFASGWLVPRLERFSALRPETEVILIDSAEKVGVSGGSELVVGWGQCQDDSTTVAERLSAQEEIFPICGRRSCAGGFAGATLLHRQSTSNPWDWPEWSAFMRAVGLNGKDPTVGPRLTPALLLDATCGGRGVMLANTTIAHDGLLAGTLGRPIAESMKVENSYWLLTARAERSRPEVVAFRSWLKEEFDTCFPRGGGHER